MAVFFKFAGEIIQDQDVNSGKGLVATLITISIGLAIAALILLNYIMRDFDQLDVIPSYQTFCMVFPLIFGLILLDEAKMYSLLGIFGVISGCLLSLVGVWIIGMKNGNIKKKSASNSTK